MITPGTLLGGKYLVERTLGEGGMGIVVAAKHVQLGHRVAIKMMIGDAVRNADALARFEREARAAAELSSEHVARVTDVGHFENGMPYMVMEYLEGEDLAVRIQRQGVLAVGDVIRMFIQACIGLGDAHEHGIIHRDIKPSNLFLSTRRGGRVILKVLDFGIAKANLETSDHQLTRTSAIMGSPQYMSPEQLRDAKNVDARTDIWSLGASMYEAMTGVPAFPAETLAELHVKILMEPPTHTFDHRSEIPLELDSIVMRCLAKQPAQRFRSMQELQDVLEQAERTLDVHRVAFQSNPGFLETALPTTEKDLDFHATGESHAYAEANTRSVAPPGSTNHRAGPSVGHSLPPQSRESRLFAPTFAATENPISKTTWGFTSPGVTGGKTWPLLAGGAIALFSVAFVATRALTASAPPASSPASALPAPPPPQAIAAQPAAKVGPSEALAAPAEPKRESVEQAAAALTPAPTVPVVQPGPRPKSLGSKLRGKSAALPQAEAVPQAAPAHAPKKKNPSALDPELE